MARSSLWLALGICVGLGGCEQSPAPSPAPSGATLQPASAAPQQLPAASVAPSATPAASAVALSRADFARLFSELSESGEYFFSDNYVSNETSYLQVSAQLQKRKRPGRAYIGVGPEQNFTYVSMLQPELAFILDIRRANAIEHLWYKVLFEAASTRFEFLAALIGRDAKAPPAQDAPLQAVLQSVDALPKSDEHFEESRARSLEAIAGLGIQLSEKDRNDLAASQQAFYDKGLDLAFELHEKNGRKYPSLKSLLLQQDPQGVQAGFLRSHESYEQLRKMQQQNRIIPVVGNFAGDKALPAIAKELAQRSLSVGAFYVSNVEQYLLEPPTFKQWVANVKALPADDASFFIRCYLDQGKRHPAQMEGHRTATVLGGFDPFKQRADKRGYGSFYQIATDGILTD